MILNIYTKIDQISPKELREMKEFDEENLSIYLNDPFTFHVGVIRNEGKVIAFGLIRVVTEFKMAINPELSNFKKAGIIKKLLDNAIELSPTNEIFASITKGSGHYINILSKHFHFDTDPGIPVRRF